ncbi:hypothetical protein [Treponema primitia]|uniref:hypothetical protein n=1 Tax=Treponema primitia TaxID=88058 RepID=UPI0002555362|nr:hypothetical protein [Treponema primitia]
MKKLLIILISALLLASCISTKSGGANYPRDVTIQILSGSASVRIFGSIRENVYFNFPTGDEDVDKRLRETPVIQEGRVTTDDTIILTEGQEYKYSLQTAETAMVTIYSINDSDIAFIVTEYGRDRRYTAKGTNRLGTTVSFRN